MTVEPLHPQCPPVVGTGDLAHSLEHLRWMKWNLGERVIAEKIRRSIAALADVVRAKDEADH